MMMMMTTIKLIYDDNDRDDDDNDRDGDDHR